MKIEFQNSIRRLSFLCRLTYIKIAWLNPCYEVDEASSSSHCNTDFGVSWSPSVPADSDANSNIRSLNRDWRNTFDAVRRWSWNYVKCRSSKIQHEVKPVD